MSKIVLNPVGNIIDATTAQTTINNNFATIQTAVDNTLSRDGTPPNQMTNLIDMNGQQILNLPPPATAFSPLRLQDLTNFNGAGTISTLPVGGTTAQVLSKNSNANYDVGWANSVTSIGVSTPADLTVTNSPVTSTGTIALNWTQTPTGIGSMVRATGPVLVTPNLGTPSAINLANATNMNIGAIGGLGAGVSTFLSAPTSANLATALTDETGTGLSVFNTSPTLVTPTLGVASATTINKVTLTPPATSSTLTIADGKTLTSNNSITLAGTDSTTMTFPSTSGSVVTTAATQTLTGKTLTTPIISTISNTGTLTLPTSTDTLVGRATTDTLTNKTFNSTATGNVLQVSGVTVSSGQYPGELTTGNATAGNVGEYISSTVVSGSAISLTSNVPANVTSISLPAGDWDVTCSLYYTPTSTTATQIVLSSISNTSATNDFTPGNFGETAFANAGTVTGSVSLAAAAGPRRISLASTTTIFAVAYALFTVSTMGAYGIIRARRVR